LCAGKYRAELNATTMIGQAKTIVQAEIDSACELIDFFRFAAHHALELDMWTPISTKDSTNRMIYRAMEVRVAICLPLSINFYRVLSLAFHRSISLLSAAIWPPRRH
jgi:1-pyrroline-5-carboxylate dehydrogenase